MRISYWRSDVYSSDLAERPVHRVDRLHALADAGLEIADIGVEAQTVDRLEHSGQFGTPDLGIEVLVHGCTIANLRYLIVGIIIEEGTGVECQAAAHQHILHSDQIGRAHV